MDSVTNSTPLDNSVRELEASVDRACAEMDRLREQRDELLAALYEAIQTIRTWHGVGFTGPLKAHETTAWKLYQASPEMRRINAVITKAKGRS